MLSIHLVVKGRGITVWGSREWKRQQNRVKKTRLYKQVWRQQGEKVKKLKPGDFYYIYTVGYEVACWGYGKMIQEIKIWTNT